MEYAAEYFKHDQFAKHIGAEIVSFGEGTATVKMPIHEHHLNSLRVVHGGAIFALADVAFAVSSNSHGTLAMAINASISFVKAARKGTLTADAREISLNPKLSTYTIDITDDDGDQIATFHGMTYRKKETLQEAREKAMSG